MDHSSRTAVRVLIVTLIVCVGWTSIGCRTYAYRRAADIPLASDPELGIPRALSRSQRARERAREATSKTVGAVTMTCGVVAACVFMLWMWSLDDDDDDDRFASNRALWKQGYGYNNPNAETAR